MKLVRYSSRAAWASCIAERIAGQLDSAIREAGGACLVLAGGATPVPVYERLAGIDLDWASVLVAPSDERWVPEASPRSNSAMIRRSLASGPASAARIASPYRADAAPGEGAEEWSARLAGAMPANVCLLGMGDDMHTASLFPGATDLERAMTCEELACPATMPETGEERLTLSASCISQSRHLHVLIAGDRKLQAIRAAERRDWRAAPISAFLDRAVVHHAP